MNSSPSAAEVPSPMLPRQSALDGLRGLAVVLVHLHEYVPLLWPGQTAFGETGTLAKLLGFGWIGVDLFYALSGYFIGTAVLRPAQWDAAQFVSNRLRRIVPAYYVSMLLVVLLLERVFLQNPEGWTHIGLHALFLHGLQPWSLFSINGPYWSLSVEFGFYMTMLALAPLLRTRAVWLLLAGALVVALTWRSAVWFHIEQAQRFFWALQLPGAIDEFAAGLGVAALQQRGVLARWVQRPQWLGLMALILGCILVATCLNFFVRLRIDYWGHGSAVVVSRTLLTSGFALWIVALVLLRQHPWVHAVVRYSGLGALGRISYSVYLYHVPVILVTHRWMGGWLQPGGLWLALTLTLILACASLSFYAVERRWHPNL